MSEQNQNTEERPAPANRKKYWYAGGLFVLLALIFWAGSYYGRATGVSSAGKAKRVLFYVDPMNPSHTSPEPGIAPCGMKMEPVYGDDEEQPPGLAPGSVKITPEKQQLVGVKVAKVEETPWTHTLRALGQVAVDENRIYQLNAFIDGWIVRAYPNSTGSIVRRDEPLATYYSKELPTALQTFFYASHASQSLAEGVKLPQTQIDALDAQKKLAEGSLMNLGMSRLQIDELARKRQVTQEIILYAPVTSFILSRKITPGQKFTTGQELYRLADLSRVWVLADLYGNEVNYVTPGAQVKVSLPNQKKNFVATVSEILPEFNPNTLTLKVRLEVDNPNFLLRPGMFTDIEFSVKLPPSINVPVDAVMDSGLKQLVFVDRGQGYFEPRQVKLGWRLGDRVEILEGLKPGESIVTSGNFLIDSESRMKLAAAGFFGEVTRDPVCGLSVDASKSKAAGWQSTVNHNTYSFCSPACKDHFDKTPERYADSKADVAAAGDQTAGPKAAPVNTALDPVCGQEVDLDRAKAQGLTSDYNGKTYYFVRYACKHDFDKNPGQYLSEAADQSKAAAPGVMMDPVCGLPVTTEMAKKSGRTSVYQGKTYYFDTDGCKRRFDAAPQRYLTPSDTIFSGDYKHLPTDPNLLLRLRRDFLGALPTWRTQEMPGPVQVQPQGNLQAPSVAPPRAAPQKPAPEAGPECDHEGTTAPPHSSDQSASPEKTMVQPQESQAPPPTQDECHDSASHGKEHQR